MDSRTLVADSTGTLLCSYLALILLVGLLLNATVGWWWADPLAGLGIAFPAVRKGVEAWRGEREDEDEDGSPITGLDAGSELRS